MHRVLASAAATGANLGPSLVSGYSSGSSNRTPSHTTPWLRSLS